MGIRTARHESQRDDSGFSLIELMVALSVLFAGLLGITGLISAGAVRGMQAKTQSVANQFAREAIESVFTARMLGTLAFDSVRNVSNAGVFLDGYQPIMNPGADGLVNTADDAAAGPRTYVDPGPDDLYGTADDKSITFENFQRQVLITDEDVNLRRITVNVRYQLAGITSVTTISTLMYNVN